MLGNRYMLLPLVYYCSSKAFFLNIETESIPLVSVSKGNTFVLNEEPINPGLVLQPIFVELG